MLAVLAWFAVGALVGEEAESARPGQSYPLVERSNCRYDSGQCDLENEDLQLSLTLRDQSSGPSLLLRSSHSLDAVLLAVAAPGSDGQPNPMQISNGHGSEWLLPLDKLPGPQDRLRLVVSAKGSKWYADAGTAFLERHRDE